MNDLRYIEGTKQSICVACFAGWKKKISLCPKKKCTNCSCFHNLDWKKKKKLFCTVIMALINLMLKKTKKCGKSYHCSRKIFNWVCAIAPTSIDGGEV